MVSTRTRRSSDNNRAQGTPINAHLETGTTIQDVETTTSTIQSGPTTEPAVANNSPPSDRSALSDPEITRLEEQLRQARKNHKLMTLRAKIDHINQRTQELQDRRGSSESVEVMEVPSRKRTRVDSIISDRPPPNLTMERPYEGRNIAEYDAFVARMEWHFRQHAPYFNNGEDLRKVATAAGKMNDKNMRLWNEHAHELADERITWKELQDFLMRLI
jgi:hypothetical protein